MNARHAFFGDGLKSLVVGIAFLAITDVGLVSGLDGWIFAAAVALVAPRFSICLLILIGGVQDARGMSNYWWYPAFVSVGVITLIYYLTVARRSLRFRFNDKRLLYCALFGMCVMIYGFLLSYIQSHFGGYPQSPERPPILIAGLTCFMIMIAVVSVRLLKMNAELLRGLKYVLVLAVLHGLMILFTQAFAGSTLFHSAEGVSEILSAAQLSEPTALGFPRLTGTYLTPNGFGLYMIFLLIMLAYLNWDAIRSSKLAKYLLLFAGIGFLSASLSKDVALFFAGCAFIFMVINYGLARTALLSSLIIVVMAAVIANHYKYDVSGIASAFRIKNSEDIQVGYRFQAWNYVISHFTIGDWLLGTGLAAWPIIFEKALGFKLADPHSWMLSLPGSVGLMGMAFYAYLFANLCLKAIWSSGNTRFMALILLYFVFIIDLFEILMPLGNTPITYVIWVLIGFCLVGQAKESGAAEMVAFKSNADTLG